MRFVRQAIRSSPVRIVLALVAMAPMVSFVLGYGGGCIMWYFDNFAQLLLVNAFLLFGLPPLFLLGFIWLVSELVRLALLGAGLDSGVAWLPAVAIAVALYAAIGTAIWTQSPIPEEFYEHERDSGRLYTSIYWPIGIRVLDGTTSKYTCGQ